MEGRSTESRGCGGSSVRLSQGPHFRMHGCSEGTLEEAAGEVGGERGSEGRRRRCQKESQCPGAAAGGILANTWTQDSLKEGPGQKGLPFSGVLRHTGSRAERAGTAGLGLRGRSPGRRAAGVSPRADRLAGARCRSAQPAGGKWAPLRPCLCDRDSRGSEGLRARGGGKDHKSPRNLRPCFWKGTLSSSFSCMRAASYIQSSHVSGLRQETFSSRCLSS